MRRDVRTSGFGDGSEAAGASRGVLLRMAPCVILELFIIPLTTQSLELAAFARRSG